MSLVRWCGPILAACVAALFAAGCSGDGSGKEAEVVPEIVAFAANPAAIEAGESVRLSWTTRRAAEVELADSLGATIPLEDEKAEQGSVEVTPTGSTSYVLTAVSRTGEKVTGTVSVEVTPRPEAPAIASFTAVPANGPAGRTVTLAWTTTHADSVAIHRAGGMTIDTAGQGAASGTVQIAAAADTSYTLTATGPGGSVEATVAVGVAAPPSVTFEGPSAPVAPGEAATLRWSAEGADSISIRDGAGNVVLAAGAASGELVRNEPITNTFTLTATGPGGVVSKEARIEVRPLVESFAMRNPAAVRAGEDVEIAWAVHGAEQATITNRAGWSFRIPADQLAGGSTVGRVGLNGEFVLHAWSGSLEVQQVLTLETTNDPRIRELDSDAPAVSARPDLPAPVTISWNIDGASRIALEREPGGAIDVEGLSVRADSVSLEITEATTFRMTAQNEYGSQVIEHVVGVVPAPRIESFAAIPARVGLGEPVPLVWNVADATSIRIERDGVDIGVPPNLTSGTIDDSPLVDSTYVLHSFNSLGFEIVSEPVHVTIGDPIVASFEVDRPVIPANQLLGFSWQNVGGRSLTVLDEGGNTVCTVTDAAEIASGGCSIVAPMIDGFTDYTLRVVNGVGAVATSTVQVHVVSGPMVQSLTASAPGITIGESVTFTWQVDNDAQNRTPTLALSDDLGNVYDLGGANANAGSATITPVAPGATTFTLTASTPGTTSSSASAPMVVYGIPAVVSLQATPDPIDTAGGTLPPTTTLSWATANGASLSVWALDGTGTRIEPALFTTVAPQEITAGSTLVTASIPSTSFLVVVTNGAGATAEATLEVAVDPAQILTFDADAVELIRGETVDIHWTTARADTIALTPNLASVREVPSTYSSIAGTSGATQAYLSSQYTTGVAPITFPAGFTFPWFGQMRSGLTAASGGWLSFNSPSSSSGTNYPLPRQSSPDVAIAAFWDLIQSAGVGQIWYALQTDASGQYLVVEWKDFSFSSSTYNPASLNFQIWLRANGSFEIHYGSMTGAAGRLEAMGSSATIGWQDPYSSTGESLSVDTPIPGGLSNKAWAFRFGPPASGSWGVYANVDKLYTLTVSNAHSSDSAQVQFHVHPTAEVRFAAFAPAEPEIDNPITVSWNTIAATAVSVVDGQGAVRCTAPANLIASGSCEIVEHAAGSYTYTVRAVGELQRNVVEVPLAVQVRSPISVGFTASSNLLPVGDSVTLSWNNVGVTSITLTENGVPVDLTGLSAASGSIVRSPAATTIYEMTGTDGNRVRTVRQRVAVRTAQVASFTATTNQVAPGTAVDLTWSSSGGTGAYVQGLPIPPTPSTDISATAPFIDASTSPNATQLPLTSSTGYADFTFPVGFTFPYFGEEMKSIRVFAYGYLSFNPLATATSGNTTLPYQYATQVHLAPFWDYLSTQGTGQIFAELRSDAQGRYLLIQWSGMKFGTTSYNPANLNFEVLLRENGTFEYRYGTMSSNNVNIGNGSSATIALQDPWGAQGFVQQNNPSSPTPLSNRAWLFDLRQPANGAISVTPQQTTTYEVCNSNGGYTECREQRIVVVKPGDLMFSELMVVPSGTGANPAGEWFEIRNAAGYPIDLSGFTLLSSPAETATISPGAPLILQPGQLAVFARSGGAVTPTWDYGTAISLDDVADDLSLRLGTTEIDRVGWDPTWNLVAGRSVRLDPMKFDRMVSSNDVPANWCPSLATEAYDGTNLGTPGTVGSSCLNTLYDLDVASSKPFIDIASTGTPVAALQSSSGYGQIPGDLGFSMPFFSGTVSSLWVSSDGLVSFNPLTSSYSFNYAIPTTTAPNNLVAPFWDDLEVQYGSSFVFERRTIDGNRVTILQWNDFRRYSYASRLTFQVQLWENGDVVMAYKELEGANAYVRGGNATVGLEDATGGTGLQYFKDVDRLTSGQTILFHKR